MKRPPAYAGGQDVLLFPLWDHYLLSVFAGEEFTSLADVRVDRDVVATERAALLVPGLERDVGERHQLLDTESGSGHPTAVAQSTDPHWESANGLHRFHDLPGRTAGVEDVLDHENSPTREKGVVPARDDEAFARLFGVDREDAVSGEFPQVVRHPLGEDDPAESGANHRFDLVHEERPCDVAAEQGGLEGVRVDSILVDIGLAVLARRVDVVSTGKHSIEPVEHVQNFLFSH